MVRETDDPSKFSPERMKPDKHDLDDTRKMEKIGSPDLLYKSDSSYPEDVCILIRDPTWSDQIDDETNNKNEDELIKESSTRSLHCQPLTSHVEPIRNVKAKDSNKMLEEIIALITSKLTSIEGLQHGKSVELLSPQGQLSISNQELSTSKSNVDLGQLEIEMQGESYTKIIIPLDNAPKNTLVKSSIVNDTSELTDDYSKVESDKFDILQLRSITIGLDNKIEVRHANQQSEGPATNQQIFINNDGVSQGNLNVGTMCEIISESSQGSQDIISISASDNEWESFLKSANTDSFHKYCPDVIAKLMRILLEKNLKEYDARQISYSQSCNVSTGSIVCCPKRKRGRPRKKTGKTLPLTGKTVSDPSHSFKISLHHTEVSTRTTIGKCVGDSIGNDACNIPSFPLRDVPPKDIVSGQKRRRGRPRKRTVEEISLSVSDPSSSYKLSLHPTKGLTGNPTGIGAVLDSSDNNTCNVQNSPLCNETTTNSYQKLSIDESAEGCNDTLRTSGQSPGKRKLCNNQPLPLLTRSQVRLLKMYPNLYNFGAFQKNDNPILSSSNDEIHRKTLPILPCQSNSEEVIQSVITSEEIQTVQDDLKSSNDNAIRSHGQMFNACSIDDTIGNTSRETVNNESPLLLNGDETYVTSCSSIISTIDHTNPEVIHLDQTPSISPANHRSKTLNTISSSASHELSESASEGATPIEKHKSFSKRRLINKSTNRKSKSFIAQNEAKTKDVLLTNCYQNHSITSVRLDSNNDCACASDSCSNCREKQPLVSPQALSSMNQQVKFPPIYLNTSQSISNSQPASKSSNNHFKRRRRKSTCNTNEQDCPKRQYCISHNIDSDSSIMPTSNGECFVAPQLTNLKGTVENGSYKLNEMHKTDEAAYTKQIMVKQNINSSRHLWRNPVRRKGHKKKTAHWLIQKHLKKYGSHPPSLMTQNRRPSINNSRKASKSRKFAFNLNNDCRDPCSSVNSLPCLTLGVDDACYVNYFLEKSPVSKVAATGGCYTLEAPNLLSDGNHSTEPPDSSRLATGEFSAMKIKPLSESLNADVSDGPNQIENSSGKAIIIGCEDYGLQNLSDSPVNPMPPLKMSKSASNTDGSAETLLASKNDDVCDQSLIVLEKHEHKDSDKSESVRDRTCSDQTQMDDSDLYRKDREPTALDCESVSSASGDSNQSNKLNTNCSLSCSSQETPLPLRYSSIRCYLGAKQKRLSTPNNISTQAFDSLKKNEPIANQNIMPEDGKLPDLMNVNSCSNNSVKICEEMPAGEVSSLSEAPIKIVSTNRNGDLSQSDKHGDTMNSKVVKSSSEEDLNDSTNILNASVIEPSNSCLENVIPSLQNSMCETTGPSIEHSEFNDLTKPVGSLFKESENTFDKQQENMEEPTANSMCKSLLDASKLSIPENKVVSTIEKKTGCSVEFVSINIFGVDGYEDLVSSDNLHSNGTSVIESSVAIRNDYEATYVPNSRMSSVVDENSCDSISRSVVVDISSSLDMVPISIDEASQQNVNCQNTPRLTCASGSEIEDPDNGNGVGNEVPYQMELILDEVIVENQEDVDSTLGNFKFSNNEVVLDSPCNIIHIPESLKEGSESLDQSNEELAPMVTMSPVWSISDDSSSDLKLAISPVSELNFQLSEEEILDDSEKVWVVSDDSCDESNSKGSEVERNKIGHSIIHDSSTNLEIDADESSMLKLSLHSDEVQPPIISDDSTPFYLENEKSLCFNDRETLSPSSYTFKVIDVIDPSDVHLNENYSQSKVRSLPLAPKLFENIRVHDPSEVNSMKKKTKMKANNDKRPTDLTFTASLPTHKSAIIKEHFNLPKKIDFKMNQLIIDSVDNLIAVEAPTNEGSSSTYQDLSSPTSNDDQQYDRWSSSDESKSSYVSTKGITYLCPRCNFTTSSDVQLRSHLDIGHQGVDPFACSNCPFKCPSKHILKLHKRNCHDSRILSNKSEEAFKSRSNPAYRLASAKIPREKVKASQLGCFKCSRWFSSLRALKIHEKTHEKVYCYGCSNSVERGGFKAHLASHGSLIPCSFCSFSSHFDNAALLHIMVVHKMIPSNTYFHNCPLCPLSRERFTLENLKTHARRYHYLLVWGITESNRV